MKVKLIKQSQRRERDKDRGAKHVTRGKCAYEIKQEKSNLKPQTMTANHDSALKWSRNVLLMHCEQHFYTKVPYNLCSVGVSQMSYYCVVVFENTPKGHFHNESKEVHYLI